VLQVRKHPTQMSEVEINLIESKLHTYADYALAPHARQRKLEKGVAEQEIQQALRYGKLVEVHNNVPGDVRALVELKRKKKESTAVVISLCSGEVRTVWRNDKR